AVAAPVAPVLDAADDRVAVTEAAELEVDHDIRIVAAQAAVPHRAAGSRDERRGEGGLGGLPRDRLGSAAGGGGREGEREQESGSGRAAKESTHRGGTIEEGHGLVTRRAGVAFRRGTAAPRDSTFATSRAWLGPADAGPTEAAALAGPGGDDLHEP